VEANAEHDFCLKRLIGMLRTMERAQIFCAICQAVLPGRPFDTLILRKAAVKALGKQRQPYHIHPKCFRA
jgi:hypothetical protein